MNVCQRSVAHFWSRGCRFDTINEIFQGFRNWFHRDFRQLEALKVNKKKCQSFLMNIKANESEFISAGSYYRQTCPFHICDELR